MFDVRVVALALAVLAGCGLIDPDITDFTLRLPDRQVTLDTADWQLPDGAELPAVDCGGELSCGERVAELCGAETCEGSCGGETCQAVLHIALWNTFDLAREAPELESIEGQPVVDVSIDRVWIRVTENSLDIDSPVLMVAIAPQTVMTLAAAEPIGTIDPIEAMTLVDQRELALVDGGLETLSRYLRDYATPFNLIVGTDLTFRAGDGVPTGRMVATVGVDARAGL